MATPAQTEVPAQRPAPTIRNTSGFHGQEPAYTHDLTVLLNACVTIEPEVGAIALDCRRLTYCAISSRYPGDVYDPDEKDGREMVAAARRVQTEIMSRLP